MAVAKHTPGPWSVLEHDDGLFILANGAMQIADVTYVLEHSNETGSRRLQNAHLLAAAPELLEQLQRLLRAYREAVKLHDPNHDDAYTVDAHNAIAKALGGPA